MLVELATESNGEVARSSAGDCTGGVQGLASVIGTPPLADFHILEAGLNAVEGRGSQGRLSTGGGKKKKDTFERIFILRNLLGAVGIIHQVTHCNKRVTESFRGRDPFVGIKAEHALQEVYKLSSVGFLS